MKTLLKSLVTGLLAVALTAPAAFAQDRRAFSQAELDQMLAPIALYPDALLSQILMASTYPVEVVQAARWSRANPQLHGEDAVRAVEPMDWDPSVKSLAAFPNILDRMDQSLGWTERLGEAFIVQEAQVMDTIQGLRHRAAAAGHLDPNEQMRVVRYGNYIAIEPPRPQVVYVPYYNPTVVYGAWWWPAYPPVYWAPWRGHHVRTPYAPAYLWGSGVSVRIGFFFGHFDWPRRHVTVVHHHHAPRVVVQKHTTVVHRPAPVRWQHDPHHRRGAPYRHVETRESKPAHPGSRDNAWRPGRSGDSPRPEPRNFAQPSPRPQPAAPRTDTRPSGGALEREDRRARHPAPLPTPSARASEERRGIERPAASVRDNRPVARPFASNSRDASGNDDRAAGAIADRSNRQARRPAPAAAPAVRRADDRRDTERAAAAVREDRSAAQPLASGSRSAARAARGEQRAEAQQGTLVVPRSAAARQ